jgi:tetratricopeptide (TPR) repeat protein
MVLLDLGDKEQAAQLVEDYTAKYAGRPEYMNSPDGEHAMFVPRAKEIVRRLQKRGQADEALTLAEGLTAGVDKPSLDLAKALAVSQIKTGKLAEATAATEKLLKDYPMDEAGAMAVVEVAAALREAGQLDTAMGLYEYARGIAKGTKAEAMARAGRAQVWVRQGKDKDVKVEVDAIIADTNSLPDADLAVFVIGEEYYLAGQKTGNDDLFYKSIALLKDIPLATNKDKPFTASVQYMLGLNYQYLGEYLKAASAFEDAYAADPKFMYAEYCLFAAGYCNEKLLGQKLVSEAEGKALIRHIYTQFLQIYPDNKRVSYVREWLKNNPE